MNGTKMQDHAESYKCQHGGPGELTVAEKNIFILSYAAELNRAHKTLVRAQYEELLSAELVVLEELLTQKQEFKSLIDAELMKMYFGMASDALLKGRIEDSRMYARTGVYIAMYLKHGELFWQMTQEAPEIQQETLKDMYSGLGQLSLDSGLVRFLNVQIPCSCLETAFPALQTTNE